MKALREKYRSRYGSAWHKNPRIKDQYLSEKKDKGPRIINYTRGYKQITGMKRLPIAKDAFGNVVTSLPEIREKGLYIKGKGYLSDKETKLLLSDPIVIEEKVDGHPVIVIFGGYTLFCEDLSIKHSVGYSSIPYSHSGWPDNLIVYDILEGEIEPPYRKGQGSGRWLSRSEKEDLCDMIGAPLVPLVYKGRVKPSQIPRLAERLSSFGKGEQSEGVVLKNLRKGLFGKFVNIEFQEGISDDVLEGQIHPMQRGEKNIRRY